MEPNEAETMHAGALAPPSPPAPAPQSGNPPRRALNISSEGVAAAILGVLSIVAFYVQGSTLSQQTSPRETFLFSAIQFILTLGFGWCITRAFSRSELSQNLRRFAISAYRRIADIDQMMERLADTLLKLKMHRGEDNPTDLDIVEAIVLDTRQTIRSSIADWADIIGDELQILQNIARLEQEKALLVARRTHVDIEHVVERVDERIARLTEALPARLAELARTRLSPVQARMMRIGVRDVGKQLLEQYRSSGGLTLDVRWERERSPRPHDSLSVGEPLKLVRVESAGLDAVDGEGRFVGRCLNASEGGYVTFSEAMTLLFREAALRIELIGPVEERRNSFLATVKVRVVSEPDQFAVRFIEEKV